MNIEIKDYIRLKNNKILQVLDKNDDGYMVNQDIGIFGGLLKFADIESFVNKCGSCITDILLAGDYVLLNDDRLFVMRDEIDSTFTFVNTDQDKIITYSKNDGWKEKGKFRSKSNNEIKIKAVIPQQIITKCFI